MKLAFNQSAPTSTEIEEKEEEESEEDFDDVDSFLREKFPEMTLSSPVPAQRKKNLEDTERKRKELFTTGSKFAPVQRNDIVGIDSVLKQVDGVISWLKNYDTYTKYNARPEPGVLFSGRPGTGKTYTSRYIASATSAFFVDVRDFPYPNANLGAKDIKSLFQYARRTREALNKPVILFWDEFETFASERSRQPTPTASIVSQITAELDGICGKATGILLIGCTNYSYNIDAALKRPGRMGLQVEFNAPSRTGKKILLEHYMKKINAQDIDFDTASYYFNENDVAATIEEAVQEAWSLTVKKWINTGQRGEPVLTETNLLDSFLDRLVGPPPAFIEITKEGKYRTAVHETGHALAAHLTGIPLRLVTVRPGKSHLGKTMTHHADPMSSDIAEYLNLVRVMVAGPIAERVLGIGRQAGAEGDTEQASTLARHLVDNEGVGVRTKLFNPGGTGLERAKHDINPSISMSTIEQSDADIKDIINKAEEDVEQLFVDFGAKNIDKLAKALVKNMTLTGRQFKEEVEKLGRRRD